MKVIDFRLRPPFGDYVGSWFFNPSILEKYYLQRRMPQSASAREASMEKCLQEMDEAGIDLAVTAARKEAGVGNETLVELEKKWPRRFSGLIDVNLYDQADAFREIDEFIVNGPCMGLSWEPTMCVKNPPMPVNDRRLYPIYEKCQKIDAFLVYTTGIGFDTLENGNPARLDQVARDFPELRIIVSHAGWPYVTENCWIAHVRKNIYLAPDLYIFNTPGYQDYVTAINNMLQEKCLYASCYPLVSMQAGLDYTHTLGIKSGVLEKYVYHNAATILGLGKDSI